MTEETRYKIKDYIADLQKGGKRYFLQEEIKDKFPSFSDFAITSALKRLTENKKKCFHLARFLCDYFR